MLTLVKFIFFALISSVILFQGSTVLANSNYCNGQAIKDSWGSYYPNGQKTSDSWGAYYPNGQKIKDNWGSYYPNGQRMQDSWGTYYPNGQKVKDNWGVYYPNGQAVRDSWGCYYSNGTKLEPCKDVVTGRVHIDDTNIMTFNLQTKTGQISNFNFEEKMTDAKVLMLYTVDIFAGVVTDTDAWCDEIAK